MKQLLRFISFMAALVLTLSCEHKELVYDVDWTVALTVNFDWSKAPTANPEGMSVYMFDLDKPGMRPERYDLIGKNGGRIKILPGRYSFVCINNDVENILFRNDRSFDEYSIYTRNIRMESGMNINSRFSSVTRAGLPDADEDFIMSPDSCWTGIVRNIEVVKDELGRSITFFPEISVVTIDVIISDAVNIQYSTEFGGTLDNMASCFRLSDRSVESKPVYYSFPLYSDGVSKLTTSFTVFGYDPAMPTHTLTVYAKLPDGREWTYSFDVTDQILNAPDQKHIIIRLSGLEVPKPIVNGSGFRPQVDDWLTKEIDVRM